MQLANRYMNEYVPNKEGPMPVTEVRVKKHTVQALSYRGCGGIVVKENQITGAVVGIRFDVNT